MSSIDLQLQAFSGTPITHGTLLSILKKYKTPNNKISRWLASGLLLPLKKGLYLVAPEFFGTNCPLPLIANTLYGPSYVSLDYALAHYGLIPEKVFAITSVTTQRAKSFENPLGHFTYSRIPAELF
jgi:predicted transcriptional regulator of viral defense system